MTEQITEIDTLVVGAGQAGVAMSEHLTRLDIPHLVLEKQGIAQAWRSGRWDSLVANGPAWHDRFPGMVFPDCPADSFVGKEQVAEGQHPQRRRAVAATVCWPLAGALQSAAAG